VSKHVWVWLALAVMWSGWAVAGGQQPSQESALDRAKMKEVDAAIEEGIKDRKTPGAVLVVGDRKGVLYEKAYGRFTYDEDAPRARVDTVWDIASLSKPVGCATAVMILADRGKISIKDPVAKYLPEFGNNGKEKITIEMLLLHRGGLIPDNPLKDYQSGVETAWGNIMKLKCKWEPGTHFAYSDVGFLVLGKLVERVSGQTLDQFDRANVFEPLGMKDTIFNPPEKWRPRIAPTEKRQGKWIAGEVHDPRAHLIGGVAGHAGVFSTGRDLARYCRMILNGGELEGKRIMSAETLRQMITRQDLEDTDKDGKPIKPGRGLGFDFTSSYASVRGERFEAGKTLGHTGYTGTMFWMDPHNGCFMIFLTNRVHPDDKADIKKLRREVATKVAEAMLGPGKVSGVE
jgi:CubicO group peptidase (beta-lactamase class C family)